MTIRRALLLAAVAAASAGVADRAQAQGAFGCAGGYGYGYGAWDVGRLYEVLADNVPYYAAFPPVYYSLPVPRSYGYSPFAYPPGVMTPEVVVSDPLAIENPYFSGTSGTAAAGDARPAKEASADQTTAAPVKAQPAVIVNPYVERAAPALAGR
jgi:hypothetical protein